MMARAASPFSGATTPSRTKRATRTTFQILGARLRRHRATRRSAVRTRAVRTSGFDRAVRLEGTTTSTTSSRQRTRPSRAVATSPAAALLREETGGERPLPRHRRCGGSTVARPDRSAQDRETNITSRPAAPESPRGPNATAGCETGRGRDDQGSVLGKNFITKYGTKQGIIVLGRVAPFGIGAVIGGGANAALAALAVRAARRAFGPAPESWPEPEPESHPGSTRTG